MVADVARMTPLRRLLQSGLFLLLLTAVTAIYHGGQAARYGELLQQETEAIRLLNRLQSALQDIETGQRGYVITGYDDFLEPFNRGRAELLALLPLLPQKLQADLNVIERVQQLSEARLKNAEMVIRSRRDEGFAAAQTLIMNRVGKDLMDAVRASISPQMMQLRSQIEQHSGAQAAADWWLLIAVTVFVLLLALLTPALFFVRRQQLKHDSLEQQRLQLTRELLTAQVDERKRISQLLHDDIAQTLAAAKLTLEAESHATTPEQAARLNNAADMLGHALDETRSLLGELRPPLLHELGLQAALNYELDRVRSRSGNTTLAMLWHDQGEPCRFDNGTEHSVFLLLREAIHNAIRHANAHHIRVEGHCDDKRLRVSVQDDGQGFELADTRSQEGHLGLIGMRERAASVGGRLDISSRPGRGTVISLELPRS